MTKFFKKGALVFAALFAGALLFAEPAISDYQGKDAGEKIPAWVSLFDKAVGANKTGTLEYSKATKKLYKKLGLKNDKILYYSVQSGSDKESLAADANNAAKAFALKEISQMGQEILDKKIGQGKGSVSKPSDALGLAKAADFWLETSDGAKKSASAYSILQITALNRNEAANSLANEYLRAKSLLPAADKNSER